LAIKLDSLFISKGDITCQALQWQFVWLVAIKLNFVGFRRIAAL